MEKNCSMLHIGVPQYHTAKCIVHRVDTAVYMYSQLHIVYKALATSRPLTQ